MPVYDFDFNESNPIVQTSQYETPKDGKGLEQPRPAMLQKMKNEGTARDDILFERQNVDISQEVHEIMEPGFRTMDRGIKNYFAGMPVPTQDSVRMLQVRISGGDKPYLVWAQDLRKGRISLPVMSITRESSEFHYEKFSPEGHYMNKRYLDSDASRVALVYRPIPAKISYLLSVWAEHKRDLEVIGYQLHRRFFPTAEFLVEDDHLRGSVFMTYDGVTFAVDDEVPAEQRQNKRHDYRITMEGWIPLPNKVVPTILGTVTTLREGDGKLATGELLGTISGKKDLPLAETRRRDG